jgi:hypothetical protein
LGVRRHIFYDNIININVNVNIHPEFFAGYEKIPFTNVTG